MKTPRELQELVSKLPKYPGVHGRDRYFNAAVLIPLVFMDGEYHLLFEKRAASIRQGSEICFPGGGYESEIDSDYRETAIRESIEELGIAEEKIEILGRLDTMVANMGVIIEPFVGVLHIDSLDELSIDHAEVEKVFTLPITYFQTTSPETYKLQIRVHPSTTDQNGDEVILLPVKELGLPERYHKPWRSGSARIFVYQTEFDTIWGITAEIIHGLLQYLPQPTS